MEFTGERFVPDAGWPRLANLHWHRYLFAAQWATNKSVLDIGSGEGYGSALLAEQAAQVLAVDVDPNAIAHARETYRKPNLEFVCSGGQAIPVGDERNFDLVVCLETIEHLGQQEQGDLLREVKRLIAPRGVLVISTPESEEYNRYLKSKNEHHLHEFSTAEFSDFLGTYFAQVKLFGQRVFTAGVIWPLHEPLREVNENLIGRSNGRLVPLTSTAKVARYIVAVCSDAPLPNPASSLLLDASDPAPVGRAVRPEARERQIKHLRSVISHLDATRQATEEWLQNIEA
jgi:ubiquinone/menaquinone biosynthesis C-methylase UbiE